MTHADWSWKPPKVKLGKLAKKAKSPKPAKNPKSPDKGIGGSHG